VFVRRNTNRAKIEKYQVFHAHPGPNGEVIPQKFEYAWTMESAMKKTKVHLRHWNDERRWASDRDYGKAS
jgi:hypothetical protein